MDIGFESALLSQLLFFFGLPVQVTLQIWMLMICLSGIMMVFLDSYGSAYAPFLNP